MFCPFGLGFRQIQVAISQDLVALIEVETIFFRPNKFLKSFNEDRYTKAPSKRTQHCWSRTPSIVWMHVTCFCTPCCMLLRVVGTCCAKFGTGQTLSYVKTYSTSLANNSRHWELLANNVESVCKGLNLFSRQQKQSKSAMIWCLCGCLIQCMYQAGEDKRNYGANRWIDG